MRQSEKSHKEMRLSLGGIVISLEGETTGFPAADNPYRAFTTTDEADVKLDLCRGRFPGRISKGRVFDAAGAWRITRENSSYIITTTSGTAVFDRLFSQGKIYRSIEDASAGPDFALTYPLAELMMINLLCRGRGVLVHACGIVHEGRGFLFAGSSGAGKSTIANLWKKKNVVILSDDRIIIREREGRFWMYGTPWHGDARVHSPRKAPLEKVFFLLHADTNYTKSMRHVEAASRLLVCIFPPFWDREGMDFTLEFCAQLACRLPFFNLGFIPDDRITDFIKE